MLDATLWLVIVCLMLGSGIGLLAGLLGIGGGLLIVPVLYMLLPGVGLSPSLTMPMAIGTSLASIIVTSSSSAFLHYQLGNIQLSAIKTLLPGILVGGFMGSCIADQFLAEYLPRVFGVIVLLLALQMILPLRIRVVRSFPSVFKNIMNGGIIGVVSSLIGISGGALTVPYLNYYGVEMRKAIGTSSLCGVFLSVSGMTGFVIFGLSKAEILPDYSVGYVYLPALFSIVSTSVLTTKYGARLALRLPTPIIKRVFAVFLFLMGVMMFLS
ncbi:sulfite exporter TauE/SafE family protein [Candidatus Enterovibrio altilux]|uniref:Probable membrane transporter protein n=1 Tax=Candidatus Enterovibrio altilux TaxID=1927128 RepID=A0A291B9H7_9GAMM|nr:sulfite exporter TauE/SafE family protein [Candidatus Enterovibrio luxaltus]ATF09669.1 Protein of unknown function DUF81 [Candidatus Enterovibrio luxaltus]